jgi:hypothetical protein
LRKAIKAKMGIISKTIEYCGNQGVSCRIRQIRKKDIKADAK